MAKVHVWYKMSGEIVAVGRPTPNASCLPSSANNQSVLELEIDESQIPTLHQTHAVDPRRLVAVKIQTK